MPWPTVSPRPQATRLPTWLTWPSRSDCSPRVCLTWTGSLRSHLPSPTMIQTDTGQIVIVCRGEVCQVVVDVVMPQRSEGYPPVKVGGWAGQTVDGPKRTFSRVFERRRS